MNILLSTSGTLGDILILFPILSGIRAQYSEAHIVLLNKHISKQSASPLELVRQAGYADEICAVSNLQLKLWKILSMLPYPGKKKYDEVYFLQRDGRSLPGKLRREIPFLQRLSRNPVRGACALENFEDPRRNYPRIMELLLARINHENPKPIRIGSALFPLSDADRRGAAAFRRQLGLHDEDVAFAVCIGGKQPVSHWPLKKYIQLLSQIITETNAIPVFLGGPADQTAIQQISSALPKGKTMNASGLSCDLRAAIAFMNTLKFYLGNDTGSIHMAAAAGLRCIGMCSSHDPAGLWYPLGNGHRIFRADPVPDCIACRKQICPLGTPAPCLDSIKPEQVFPAVLEMLK